MGGARVTLMTTPLQRAAWLGDYRTIEAFLAAGAEVDEMGEIGLTPLMFASKEAKARVVRLLIEHGAKVNRRARIEPFISMSPLHLAVSAAGASSRAIEATVRALLSARANVHACASGNWTALHNAAAWPRANIVSILLEAGADPDARTRAGDTPLLCLVSTADPRRSSSLLALNALLRAGAKPQAANKRGETPVSVAEDLGKDRFSVVLRRSQ